MATKISDDVLDVLARSATEASRLVLPAGLERKLYEAVNKVLVAAGGKWSRKDAAHVFPSDAAELIEPIVLSGEYTRTKQEFGQFDTPPELAARIVEMARIEPGMYVLEPSVGIGSLVSDCEAVGAKVEGFEIDLSRHEIARQTCRLEGGLRLGDFLLSKPQPAFDRVVMNPPFARQADIAHVLHAARFLKPGGRLVAIMSAAVAFRTDARTRSFREHVQALGGTIERLPDNSFRSSGTGVNACVVVFDVF